MEKCDSITIQLIVDYLRVKKIDDILNVTDY